MKTLLKQYYQKYGKKFLIVYGIWTAIKWTLVLVLGNGIWEWVQHNIF